MKKIATMMTVLSMISALALTGCSGNSGKLIDSETINGVTWEAYCPKGEEPGYLMGMDFTTGTANQTMLIKGTGDFIGIKKAFNRTGIKTVTIEEGITGIGDEAFEDFYALESIIIAEGVTSIGDNAFTGCIGLSSAVIPGTVSNIGKSAFENCRSLISAAIPDGMTSIAEAAFRQCESLTSVTIPEGITSIGEAAFAGCNSLTSVTIPASVTSIGSAAFAGVESDGLSGWYVDSTLTDIYYTGTEEQWNAIEFGDGGTYIQNTEIHYSTAEPKAE